MIRQREEQERIMDDKQARRRYARGKTRKTKLIFKLASYMYKKHFNRFGFAANDSVKF